MKWRICEELYRIYVFTGCIDVYYGVHFNWFILDFPADYTGRGRPPNKNNCETKEKLITTYHDSFEIMKTLEEMNLEELNEELKKVINAIQADIEAYGALK